MYSAPGINEVAPEGFEEVGDAEGDTELEALLWGAVVMLLDAALFPALAPKTSESVYLFTKMCRRQSHN